ncbi:prepilin-type N-terminal cleavage/methylation domain-containing protein [Peptococcaceae bacterium]|nr:prepilin-type N-terminal cleavage/methylation domain-containing protein [Peptococcaceae bacterium]
MDGKIKRIRKGVEKSFKLFFDKKGFTIIEVMLVVMIVLLAIVPLMNVFIQSEKDAVATLQRTQAVFLAQSILEEYKAKDFNNIATGTSVVPKTTIEIGNHSYGYEVRVGYYNENKNLKQINVTVRYEEFGRTKSVELATLKTDRRR